MTHPSPRPPLRVAPAASCVLAAYVATVHAGALAVGVALPLPPAGTLLLAALILAGFAHAFWVHVLRRAPWSVVEVTLDDDGVSLLRRDGRGQRASLSDATYVGVHVLVLHMKSGRLRRDTLVLSADAMDAPTLRRLRTRLRLGEASPARAVDLVTDRNERLR
ncbi:MAG: hypothetical protein K9M02_01200 [Thiohalocapsa sp.]|nr:hypothetical protein [Thiohalocapsa sp.]